MEDRNLRCSRRRFLAQAAALTMAGGVPAGAAAGEDPTRGFRTKAPRPAQGERKPIAVVCSVYRPLAHAYHIVGRFLHGYPSDGRLHVPGQFVRSMYVEQIPDNDVSRKLAGEFKIRLGRSIAETLIEGDRLSVSGVLLIAEQGNYPRNDRDQILYPRYEMMEQIVGAFRRTGHSVPVFNDKHLSYSWEKARQMLAWSQELHFPLMAGSSLPVTWRRPELELPLEAPVEDALVAGHGPVEIYGFHALEALQVMLERRKGGETGIRAVTCLTGKDVWKAGDAGRWSWDLLEAALGRSETLNPGDIRDNVGNVAVGRMPLTPAYAFLIEYRDGTRGTALLLNGHIQDFCFAARLKGETKPASCLFYLPPPPGAKYFDCLAAQIEKLFETWRSPTPIERTLLTGGALEAAMESRYRKGERVETPHLDVRYAAPADTGFCRWPVTSPV
jgi:hypothetical protein